MEARATTRSSSTTVIERHYSGQAVAELLSVNPATVRRAAESGDLRSKRVGRVRRYAESAVKEWIEFR